MFKPHVIADFVRENVRETGNPFGIDSLKLNDWWMALDLNSNAKKILFTGLLYQLAPYTTKIANILSKLEETVAEKVAEKSIQIAVLRKLMAPFLSAFSKEKTYYNEILRKIALVLMKHRIEFKYDPRLDFYSGILLHDLGDEEEFANQASKVAGALKEGGVKEIITVDPHTTYALKVLYPRYTDFDVEVTTYFELLPSGNLSTSGKANALSVTLHDPCYYGRYLEISDVPRRILEDLDIEVVDVRNSGKLTSCCGGPIESFSPNLAGTMAKYRAEELEKTGCPIVTMCPICLSNFRRSVNAPSFPFTDFIEILYSRWF